MVLSSTTWPAAAGAVEVNLSTGPSALGPGRRKVQARSGYRRGRAFVMWFGVGIIGLIIWIAIAFWPARVAGRKGHSFIGFFILSLFFFPLALILAYVVRDRR